MQHQFYSHLHQEQMQLRNYLPLHQSGQSFKLQYNQAIANLKDIKLNNTIGLPESFNDFISSILLTQRCSLACLD